ncbi:MAG: hypothetical protein ACJ735_10760 [Actinomycetes bacterium]
MRVTRMAKLLAAVVPMTGMLVAGTSGVANAACVSDRGWYVDVTSSSSYHLPAPGTYFKDGPGGTMTVSVQNSTSVSASMSYSTEVSVSDIVSSVKAQISASAERSQTITVGHTYSHSIPSGYYGNLQYGSWGYYVHWEHVYDNGNCTYRYGDTGTAKVPSTAVGWKYWSTSS